MQEKVPKKQVLRGKIIMKNKNIDNQQACKYCNKDHQKERLDTFHGAFGNYCLPKEKIAHFKRKLRISPRFKKYLSLNDISKKDLIEGGDTWRKHYHSIDNNIEDLFCRHGIAGGCVKCIPNNYAGSRNDEPEEAA